MTAAQAGETGHAIERMQAASGAIAWPDGHVDAWDHIECAMALSACGLSGAARRAYRWLRRAQRADGSFTRSVVGGTVADPAAEAEIGLERVVMFHFNDTQVPLGAARPCPARRGRPAAR